MQKRGQGLSTNAIILIVLGVFVLAVLILGFSLGWNKLAPWVSTGSNINDIKTACSVACSTQSVYDFCTQKRTLTVDGTEKEKDTNCNVLSNKTEYGVVKCPVITCP